MNGDSMTVRSVNQVVFSSLSPPFFINRILHLSCQVYSAASELVKRGTCQAQLAS